MFNLDNYINPSKGQEASHKGIPMEYRYHPDVLNAKGKGRIRYRGPRYDAMRLSNYVYNPFLYIKNIYFFLKKHFTFGSK